MEIERHDVELVVRVEQQRARRDGGTLRRAGRGPGTISAVSKRTVDTIAHAVRESSDAIRRSTSVSTGRLAR